MGGARGRVWDIPHELARIHSLRPGASPTLDRIPALDTADVLQRVGIHPDSDIEALMPRIWNTRFADQPLRSDLERATA
ncbi:MAG: hypothetical protein AB7Q97_22140 [Gammaproteobacteria bacterium]